jgi:hypothetical protein
MPLVKQPYIKNYFFRGKSFLLPPKSPQPKLVLGSYDSRRPLLSMCTTTLVGIGQENYWNKSLGTKNSKTNVWAVKLPERSLDGELADTKKGGKHRIGTVCYSRLTTGRTTMKSLDSRERNGLHWMTVERHSCLLKEWTRAR